jgi:hypothetical protein
MEIHISNPPILGHFMKEIMTNKKLYYLEIFNRNQSI